MLTFSLGHEILGMQNPKMFSEYFKELRCYFRN